SDDVHPGDREEHPEAGRPVIGGELMSDPLRYLVVFEHSEGTGYSAWVPDLPGCIAAAETREECERLIREAIALHLTGMREEGAPLPEPSAVEATRARAAAAC